MCEYHVIITFAAILFVSLPYSAAADTRVIFYHTSF